MSPRGLLIEFCQQHRLPDPIFILSYPGRESQGQTDLDGKIPDLDQVTELDETSSLKLAEIEKNDEDGHSPGGHSGPFFCTVRVEFQRGSVTGFESGGPYRNRHDAIQSCALKALHSCRPWFESTLRGSYEPIIPNGRILSDADGNVLKLEHDETVMPGTRCCWEPSDQDVFGLDFAIDSSQIEKIPPAGAMVTIRYTVRWFRNAHLNVESSNFRLEKKEDFTFELGIGAVIGTLDSVVAETPVGQIVCFFTSLPASTLFLAVADDPGGEDEVPDRGKFFVSFRLIHSTWNLCWTQFMSRYSCGLYSK